MKKRILSLLLAFALLCGLLSISSVSVHAYSKTDIAYPVEGGNIYFDKERGAITDCDNTVTSADIPAEIDGVEVTRIGSFAFQFCSNLTSVTIPDSVTSIGEYAFSCCESLKNATIPNGVTSIGDAAFKDCNSLMSVTIPDSVTDIGWDAFQDCTSLTSVTIPKGLTCIEVGSFYGCSSLTTLTISDSVTHIGGSAFRDCNSLMSVTIPDSVTHVDSLAFKGCSSLTSVTIPKNLTSIDSGAFSDCSSLTDINVAEGNSNYISENGILFNKNKTILHAYPAGKTQTEYVISDNVTTIDSLAFSGCSSLTSITIPDGITSIEWGTFEGCSSLTTLTIPNGVTSIGGSAFEGCSSLTTLTIPNGVTSIGGSAFEGCSSLTTLTIPNSVTSIGDFMFAGCSSLTSVTIPEGVTSIGDFMFAGCSSLTSVMIPDSVTSISVGAFARCSSLTRVMIPSGVTSIELSEFTSVFEDCSSLTVIDVAEGNTAFLSEEGVLFNKDKTMLHTYPAGKTEAEYTIPVGVTSIGMRAFDGCRNLKHVTIPDSMTSIDKLVFEGCSSLTSVTIPDSVTSIYREAFRDCSSLTSVMIPDSVTRIDFNVFMYCSSLTAIDTAEGNTAYASMNGVLFNKDKSILHTYPSGKSGAEYAIPDSVTHIYVSAFRDCNSLMSVTIPGSVKSIYHDAFYNCSSLKTVCFIGDVPTQFEDDAFKMWDDKTEMTINIPGLILYYIEGKEGWTSPTWNGYPTATWDGVNIPHTHSYQAVATAPTCTEKGFTTHTCECGASYIDTYIDALGHDFGEWTQTKAPTCTEKGVEKRTCSRCGDYETREAAATGHTEVIDKAVPATCTEAGKTEGKHCSVCKTVLVAQEENPALGHSYENGVCVRCGEKDSNAQKPVEFADVPKNAWYVGAVEYAVRNGLMNGVGNNRFDPEGKITREQMATILYRYAEKKEIDTGKRAELGAFPDAKQVSAYAKNPVQWAVAEKIINGSDGKLLPQGDATRAQVATILMRFIENIVKE
ncbi:MAG: leucine-rich repeat protein [Faecousia sp.]